jgi:hypothetical protein
MKRRDFNRIALGIALSPILANTAFAQVTGQTESDPMAAVRKYIDAFNKGDTAGMAAMFAVPGSIIDGMASHVWQGPTAAQDWYRDVLIEGKHHGASEYFVTLGEPLHNNVTGDSAYVVVPATMTFKLQGKQITQSGAIYTWRFAGFPMGGASLPGPGRR